MKISLQGNKRRNTLILGNTLNDPDNNISYYAKLEGTSTVFTVKANQYDQFIQAHKDLREKTFIKLNRNLFPRLISQTKITTPNYRN